MKKQWKRKIGFHSVLFTRVIESELEAFPSLIGGGKVKNSKQITVFCVFYCLRHKKILWPNQETEEKMDSCISRERILKTK